MNKNENVYESLSKRGNGTIYLGVVGPVRCGKSTFIRRFIENLVVPNCQSDFDKNKCMDEMPQTGMGKTIMTVEPKFVPSSGATIEVEGITCDIKLVDCVGYVSKDALGYLDDSGSPRLVKCPWREDYIPFEEAAEIGTSKVIKDHATIGIVITTDGSITELSRESYIESEQKVIEELKSIGKPFVVLLNSKHPYAEKTLLLKEEISKKYEVEVISCSVDELKEPEIKSILNAGLREFPVSNVNFNIPSWIDILPIDNKVKSSYLTSIKECMLNVSKVRDTDNLINYFKENDYIKDAYVTNLDAGSGDVDLTLKCPDSLFDSVLLEVMGKKSMTKKETLEMYISYNENNKENHDIKNALRMAKNTGYGIIYPSLNDLELETPEIIKTGTRYGVKLKAKASSIHLIKVDVSSTFEPIIGSESQVKELVDNMMHMYEEDKSSIWKSEIFGRTLEQIVDDGVTSKLSQISDITRQKMENTLTKVVNKGSNNVIAIVL